MTIPTVSARNLVGARRCLALGDPSGRPYDRLDAVRPYHRGNEPIPAPRQGLDKLWMLCQIAQRIAQPADRVVQAVFDITE